MLYVIFPNNELVPREVEPEYSPEFNICGLLGINTILIDHTRLTKLNPGFFKRNISGGGKAIYRGWMLSPKQYEFMYNQFLRLGIKLVTNPIAYKAAHYYPIAHSFISDHCAPAIWEPLPSQNLRPLYNFLQIHNKVVLKDYVKSEKYTRFQFLTSDISRDDFVKTINDFKEYRGESFNVGIVLKKYVDCKEYFDRFENTVHNEWRAFVLNGKVMSLDQNSHLDPSCVSKPDMCYVETVIKNLSHISPFFSIDFIENSHGKWTVIETGDGQVSGLCSQQSSIQFFGTLQNIISPVISPKLLLLKN